MRDGDTWFFTMELVPGADIVSYVRGATPASDEGLSDATTRRDPVRTCDITSSGERPKLLADGPSGFDETRLRGALAAAGERPRRAPRRGQGAP